MKSLQFSVEIRGPHMGSIFPPEIYSLFHCSPKIENLFDDVPCKRSEYDRKYHNNKLQTNPWRREEEPHNNHETPRNQTKQSNQPSLLHKDDCKTRMDTKQRTTKADTYNGSNNKQ